MIRILFLCRANSCRSQMAEGWARHWGNHKVEVYSAGEKATLVQPRAVRVMKERGVDISSQWSKAIDKVPAKDMDFIISLCEEGVAFCPQVVCRGERLNMPVDDPVSVQGTDEEIMSAYRLARDTIEKKIVEFLQERGLI